jgi:hypothetical protein
MLGKRSAASFDRALAKANSILSATPGRTVANGGTGSAMCRANTTLGLDPTNGGCPTSISYNTHAKLYWSLRPSKALSDDALIALPQRDAEVGNNRVTSLEQDVAGLYIPVHHVVVMCVAQAICYFGYDPNRLIHCQLFLAIEPLSQ